MKINLSKQFVSPVIIEGLLNTILDQMQPQPELPILYTSGVRYRTDYGEDWQAPSDTASLGYGDCEDLCLYRCIELRTHGHPARCKVYRSAPRLLHVIVDRMDGRFEDPSRALGMRDARMGYDDQSSHIVDVMPPGFKVTPQMVLDPRGAAEAAATQAAIHAAASLIPGGSIALELLSTPEGTKLAKALLKRARKFW